MDERVKNEYRKIYSELVALLIFVTAASAVIKVFLLNLPPSATATEFIIMIGSPVYLWIRQTMLGLDPEASLDEKKRRKNFAVSFTAGILVLFLCMLLKYRGVNADVLFHILSFAVIFSAVYILSRKFARKNAERKAKKYEDD